MIAYFSSVAFVKHFNNGDAINYIAMGSKHHDIIINYVCLDYRCDRRCKRDKSRRDVSYRQIFFFGSGIFKRKTKPKHVSFFLLYFKNNMSEEYYIYIFVIALFSGAVFHVYKVHITSYAMK
jgi:hypothetical protein